MEVWNECFWEGKVGNERELVTRVSHRHSIKDGSINVFTYLLKFSKELAFLFALST